MFSINTFESSKGQNKGQDVQTVMIGTNDDPRKNRHIGASMARDLIAILSDSTLCAKFMADLHTVAGVAPSKPVPAKPVTPPTMAPHNTPAVAAALLGMLPPANNVPKLTTEETIQAIQDSQNARKDKTGRAGSKPAKRGRKATVTANLSPAVSTVNVSVASVKPEPETLDSLKAKAKAAGLKIKGNFGSVESYRKAIAKAGGLPVTKPVAMPEPVAAPSQTKAPKNTLITNAIGADGFHYAIYRTENGTLIAVADSRK